MCLDWTWGWYVVYKSCGFLGSLLLSVWQQLPFLWKLEATTWLKRWKAWIKQRKPVTLRRGTERCQREQKGWIRWITSATRRTIANNEERNDTIVRSQNAEYILWIHRDYSHRPTRKFWKCAIPSMAILEQFISYPWGLINRNKNILCY